MHTLATTPVNTGHLNKQAVDRRNSAQNHTIFLFYLFLFFIFIYNKGISIHMTHNNTYNNQREIITISLFVIRHSISYDDK